MPFHTGIELSAALIISAMGLALSILGGAAAIFYRLGKMQNSLEGLSEVDTLTTQIETLTNTFDVAAAGRAPENIDMIREDIDEISDSVDTLDDVDQSVDNIEAAITAVDLPGIQDAIEELFKERFDQGSLPIGNSVHYTLDESGLEIAISFEGVEEDVTKVTVRIEERVQLESIINRLDKDAELMVLEEELFVERIKMSTPSPRQINLALPTTNMEVITECAHL